MILPRLFIRQCRNALRRSKVADSTGSDMSGGNLLMRTLILRRILLRNFLSPAEKYVGILLPPSAGGVIANAALPLAGRIGVNLNYTVSSDTLNYCLQHCGIKHVITSRKFMEKVDLELNAELIYLEDLKPLVTTLDKVVSTTMAYAMPAGMLERSLGLLDVRDDDVFTVIFTSGSTGRPKGVTLSYRNIGSNVEAIDQVVKLNRDDVLCGILPFFHSLGFTVTLWAVLGLDIKGIYHFSPLDARQIGKLAHEHRATILLSTPTFLRSFLRRCQPEEFATLDVVVAGAEKLPSELCDAFQERFGVRPVEGYGTTELSPLVSVNIPPSRAPHGDKSGLKEGTVGRPVPGVKAKIVHPETGAELGRNEPGLLLIQGPNVMLGYLHQPELTAKVMRDGWYITGDIAILDSDGFIQITGRQSRFSKIGGEMVPHVTIEEALQKILGTDEQKQGVAVSAVPDERKGERLIVLHTAIEKSVDQVCKELSAAGLPNLWIPGTDSFFLVEEIPVLGTGKLDLQGVKQLAQAKAGERAAVGAKSRDA